VPQARTLPTRAANDAAPHRNPSPQRGEGLFRFWRVAGQGAFIFECTMCSHRAKLVLQAEGWWIPSGDAPYARSALLARGQELAIQRETLFAFVRISFTYAGPLERDYDDDDQTEARFEAFLDEVARGARGVRG
jgi:hypothetical protein